MSETNMNWIAFGDIHQHLNFISLIPELPEADGVIITGDLTDYSPPGAVETVWSTIAAINPEIMAQGGNMDRENVTNFLKSKDANLHLETRELAPSVKIMGVGCSIPTPFRTPSEVSEEKMSTWLEETYTNLGDYSQFILAVHDAPYDTKLDIISSGLHVGSHAVRNFVEQHQPEIVLCGHIHESCGEDFIGSSHILNPGMASDGGYVKITLKDGKLEATLKKA